MTPFLMSARMVLIQGDGLVDLLLGPDEAAAAACPRALPQQALQLHLFLVQPRLVFVIRPPFDIRCGEAGLKFRVRQRLKGLSVIEAITGPSVIGIHIGHKRPVFGLGFHAVHAAVNELDKLLFGDCCNLGKLIAAAASDV